LARSGPPAAVDRGGRDQMDYAPGNTCSLSLSGEDEGELRGIGA
jgi:hypothetical protein